MNELVYFVVHIHPSARSLMCSPIMSLLSVVLTHLASTVSYECQRLWHLQKPIGNVSFTFRNLTELSARIVVI